MPKYYEDKEEDGRACGGVMEDLRQCLLESPCVLQVSAAALPGESPMALGLLHCRPVPVRPPPGSNLEGSAPPGLLRGPGAGEAANRGGSHCTRGLSRRGVVFWRGRAAARAGGARGAAASRWPEPALGERRWCFVPFQPVNWCFKQFKKL